MQDARASGLPAYATTLYGREREREALIDLLLRDETRLVTLLGPGGIGKTRLAVAVATAIAEQGASEVIFVDLSTVSDARGMLEILASTLHAEEDPGAAPEERIGAELRARTPLVILDNIEQVQDAAPLVDRLLGRCPGVTFMATSRIPLRLSGERQYPVSTLLAPPAAAGAPGGEHHESPAVALFVDRAQAVRPDFVLTDGNVDDVMAICARVDGLPLAIELAATRLRIFSPSALLAEISDRLSLLSRGPVDRPLRQQTIHQAIAWSTELLDAAELEMLQAVATFDGAFSFEAAQAVADSSRRATADLLSALVEKSLLQSVPTTRGNMRFRLLHTVRDVVREAMDEEGQGRLAVYRQRQAAHYARFASDLDAGLMGDDQAGWVEQAEAEYANLRSALAFSFDQRDANAAVGLVASLWPLWIGTGRLEEGRLLLDHALAIPGDVDLGNRARALNGLGALRSALGDFAAATTACEGALELWRQVGDTRSVANVLNNLGTLAERLGRNTQASDLYNQALGIFTDLDDRFRASAVMTNLGNIANTMGNLDLARALHQRALGIRRALKDTNGIAQSLHNLGLALDALGDHEGAGQCFAQALPIFEELHDPRMVAITLNGMGAHARDRGNLPEADTLLRHALDITREIGDAREEASILGNLGTVAFARQDVGSAMQAFRESLEITRRISDPLHALPTLEWIADLAIAAGDNELAATLLGFVKGHGETVGSPGTELEFAL